MLSVSRSGQACPACGEEDIAARWPATKLGPDKSIVWCGRCGFGWQYPLPTPEAIRRYYDDNPPYNIHGERERESLFRMRVGRLSALRPQRGKLLDVGSGLGHFLQAGQANGWSVAGIEPHQSAAELCRRDLGIEVHVGTMESVSVESESCDVITLWDVWEHVHEPLDFLDRCLSLLRPGGMIAIAVPNASGLPARLFKGNWRYVMRTHLNYFSTAFIATHLERRGFRIVRTDHTVKVQSLVQGAAAKSPVKINMERVLRLGRRGSTEYGRVEMSNIRQQGVTESTRNRMLALTRKAVVKLNRASMPFAVGDVVDVYATRM